MLCGSVILPIVCLLWPFIGALIPAPTYVVELKKQLYIFFMFFFERVRKKKKSIAEDIPFSLTGATPSMQCSSKKGRLVSHAKITVKQWRFC